MEAPAPQIHGRNVRHTVATRLGYDEELRLLLKAPGCIKKAPVSLRRGRGFFAFGMTISKISSKRKSAINA